MTETQNSVYSILNITSWLIGQLLKCLLGRGHSKDSLTSNPANNFSSVYYSQEALTDLKKKSDKHIASLVLKMFYQCLFTSVEITLGNVFAKVLSLTPIWKQDYYFSQFQSRSDSGYLKLDSPFNGIYQTQFCLPAEMPEPNSLRILQNNLSSCFICFL